MATSDGNNPPRHVRFKSPTGRGHATTPLMAQTAIRGNGREGGRGGKGDVIAGLPYEPGLG